MNLDIMSGAIDGKPKCTRDPNGASARYQYHPDNTLRQLVNRSAAATVLTQHDYTYDSVGNRLKHIEKIGATTTVYDYAYDPLDRLTQVRNGTPAQQEDYAYDPLHNRTQKTVNLTTPSTLAYLYDAANQLKEIRQTNASGPVLASHSYDFNGNLISKTEGTTVTSLAYDPLNQLTQASKTGLSTQSYQYDDQGRRIQKTVGATITNYLYNGPDIVAEYAGSATSPTALYAHDPNWDDPLIRLSGSNPASPSATAQYYHADGLGSVVGLSTNQNTTTQTQRFDAWGNKLAGTIPQTAQYGYTGREPDETGLIYYRARYYDPTAGRFTQRDPVGLNGGINLYTYVGNNPINNTDPLGLRELTAGESGMMGSIFGSSVLNAVDVQQGANWNPIAWVALNVMDRPAITLGNTIHMQADYYAADFSTKPVPSQGLLVHETTHVWQNQTNGFASTATGSISENMTQGSNAYNYTLSPSSPGMMGPPKPLNLYGVEQQAALVEDYYYLRNNVPLTGAIGSSVTLDNRGGYQSIYEGTLSSSGLMQPGQQSLGTMMNGGLLSARPK